MSMKAFRYTSKHLKDLLFKRHIKRPIPFNPLKQSKQNSIYSKNVHLSHEYGFHPSLRRHFKHAQSTFATQAPKLRPIQQVDPQQNDFFEMENFNDYVQFGYAKISFDSVDVFIGSAAVLCVGGFFAYNYSDKIIADDDLLDSALFG
eukprot:185609_1